MNQVSPPPAGDGAVIEVDRTVNASGLADQQVGVGSPLAGQRVTLRMEGPLMAVLGHDGRSCAPWLPCPGGQPVGAAYCVTSCDLGIFVD